MELEKQLKFLQHIVSKPIRSHLLIWSDNTKQVVLNELAVPWEDHLEEAFERKLPKCQDLISLCRPVGWKTNCLSVEDGCRGFAARSLARAFSTIGSEGEKSEESFTISPVQWLCFANWTQVGV